MTRTELIELCVRRGAYDVEQGLKQVGPCDA